MRRDIIAALMLIAFAVCFAVFVLKCGGVANLEGTDVVKSDTVVIRDTLRLPVPAPEVRVVVRRDTVRLPAKPVAGETVADATTYPSDSANVQISEVIIPITRNTYRTEEYTAVVEGYRPSLVSMEVYPKTTTITRTVTRLPRWALTVGPGVGYGPNGVQPYVGVTLGFVLWSK